ncbi:acyl-CoA/acyl-ACP dehydrogenase [Candidatus Bathyarchaeota archaeon]|nr:acyl-CoA/acyl-ACP dehydrogenase [Candidatus Bathyarchaeota archaeon]
MVDGYPWWNERHKELAVEAKEFADENIHRGEEVFWTKKFPEDLLKTVAEKGWFGVLIPEQYGGMNVGATGSCIVTEELSRICSALANVYCVTFFSGTKQLLNFGNEEQRKRWLPKIAKGTVAGVCITEPYIGSDAAAIETTAERDGDFYIINGKKRFTTNVGIADMYLVYAKTSEKTEDKARYKHLSAFIVEKGSPGFTIERVNELTGWYGLPNGYLDFENVKVPVENMIGNEGDGWKIMMAGLNFERTLFTAGMLGPMREALRYAVGHAERRIQFGQPTINAEVNQFKIADMIAGYETSRLLVYYAAYLTDLGMDNVLYATMAKLYTSETYEKILSTAIQVMGGDGWTKFYPLDSFMRDAKVNQIGAGTSEVMRMILFRQGLRTLKEDLKFPARRVHETLKVPVSTPKPKKVREINEHSLLELFAENYIVNPGLCMSREDIKARVEEFDDQKLDETLQTLETQGLVKIYRDRKGRISLARATIKGLRKAKPREAYRWFPDWISKEYIF